MCATYVASSEPRSLLQSRISAPAPVAEADVIISASVKHDFHSTQVLFDANYAGDAKEVRKQVRSERKK